MKINICKNGLKQTQTSFLLIFRLRNNFLSNFSSLKTAQFCAPKKIPIPYGVMLIVRINLFHSNVDILTFQFHEVARMVEQEGQEAVAVRIDMRLPAEARRSEESESLQGA